MTEEVITREKHPGRVAKGHRLTALMKKRKEEILCNKEQSTEQPKEQPTEQPIVQSIQSTEQFTLQSTVQSTVQSNYVYDDGILAVLAIGVCVFFTYNKKTSYALEKYTMNE